MEVKKEGRGGGGIWEGTDGDDDMEDISFQGSIGNGLLTPFAGSRQEAHAPHHQVAACHRRRFS